MLTDTLQQKSSENRKIGIIHFVWSLTNSPITISIFFFLVTCSLQLLPDEIVDTAVVLCVFAL